MKRLFGFIIFFLFVFIIISIISLLLPSKVTVTRSVEINATPDKVVSQIIDFTKWENWYPAFKDENITVAINKSNPLSVTLKGREGKNIILTRMESMPDMIIFDVNTFSSSKVTYRFIVTKKTDSQTQLTWDINTDMGWYPWKRIQGLLLDKFSGTQYEMALDNLRKAVEN